MSMTAERGGSLRIAQGLENLMVRDWHHVRVVEDAAVRSDFMLAALGPQAGILGLQGS